MKIFDVNSPDFNIFTKYINKFLEKSADYPDFDFCMFKRNNIYEIGHLFKEHQFKFKKCHPTIIIPRHDAYKLTETDFLNYVKELQIKIKRFEINEKLKSMNKDFECIL